jgi:hypothetical protein
MAVRGSTGANWTIPSPSDSPSGRRFLPTLITSHRARSIHDQFQVENLDDLLVALKREGVDVDPCVESYDYGKFGWIMDPEGNRVELWEPKSKVASGSLNGALALQITNQKSKIRLGGEGFEPPTYWV